MDEDADILSKTLDEINAESPLNDIRFDYDSAALTSGARMELESHARWLRRFRSVTVLVEGHCDERGTVEYNLALGERRAMGAYNYLLSLGVAGDQLKTISYGKEFPLDPGHTDGAWARNRRCHFVITAK
jgi:peptidoglycan-associated lipoprotein